MMFKGAIEFKMIGDFSQRTTQIDKDTHLELHGCGRINERHEHLPLLHLLLQHYLNGEQSQPLRKTAVVLVHHLLTNSAHLVTALLQLGVHPQNMVVVGKAYSTCNEVVEYIRSMNINYRDNTIPNSIGQYSASFLCDVRTAWSDLLSTVHSDVDQYLILDHGGYASALIPAHIAHHHKVIRIAKTTSGLMYFEQHGFQPFPVIDMARSATKMLLESPLIANAVVEKSITALPKNAIDINIGIVGYGAIGQALTHKLASMGHRCLMVYDDDATKFSGDNIVENVLCVDDLKTLFTECHYVFGCTGQDITKSHLDCFTQSKTDKCLVSCSSEDKEFLSLLQHIESLNPCKDNNILVDIHHPTASGATIRILSGGFPVNFDHSGQSVPSEDIQLTRSLTLAAVFQAIHLFGLQHAADQKLIYTLDSVLQKFIVDHWLSFKTGRPYAPELLSRFQKKLLKDKLKNKALDYTSPFSDRFKGND